MQCSVIICTHNPRSDYLKCVLEALQTQILAKEKWELLLIDNASKEPLAKIWDLSWHPRGRHIREDELGLTAARLRGINESTGELLVFVDDDNVLDEHYLEEAMSIAERFAHIGAFGAGNIFGDLESTPPLSVAPYLPSLVICESTSDYWSNIIDMSPARPHGAGLCVRRQVAMEYLVKTAGDPIRKKLGRCGVGLGAGEDADLAWCAIDIGLGVGRFAKLSIKHLIPKGRLTEEYIVKLFAGCAAAGEVLHFLRQKELGSPREVKFASLRFVKNLVFSKQIQRKIFWESRKAVKEARRSLLVFKETEPDSGKS